MIQIDFKRLTPTAVMPFRAHQGDAGLDLFADLLPGPDGRMDLKIEPHKTAMIGTGIAMAIPDGYFGGVYARSGLASKDGLRPANCVGVVDSGYRNEVKVALHNDTDEAKVIHHGQKIAQLIIQPYLDCTMHEVNELSNTERGMGGFGSSGV